MNVVRKVLVPSLFVLATSMTQAQVVSGIVTDLSDTLGETLGIDLGGLSDIGLAVDGLLFGGEQGGDSTALANEILLLGAPADSPLEGDNELLKNDLKRKESDEKKSFCLSTECYEQQ